MMRVTHNKDYTCQNDLVIGMYVHPPLRKYFSLAASLATIHSSGLVNFRFRPFLLAQNHTI